ncbi:MAG: SDR family oxidoreductase [Spirochaetales bacterium]|nr:SDR family oxidoreductase [Leptospiraceae bacterium]MCP5481238.1 SDR family oxidoreductase [Spirochaetales bacterium]MCP5485674.1 SDR family oxidoreductase [Spirochaetales bacterium]
MNPFSVEGKSVLITGASRGIGQALAQAFRDQGAHVYGCGTRAESIAWMAQEAESRDVPGGSLTGEVLNVTEPGAAAAVIARIIEKRGRLDCLINNAGIASNTPAMGFKEDEMEAIIDTNFKGAFRTCQAYYRAQRRQGGTIINVASILGLVGGPLASVYCGTKGAVIQLTRALTTEWSSNNFRINALAPGFTDTDMTEMIKKRPAVLEKMLEAIPMRRMGRPEDMVGAALFLASDASAYMTGQVIVVDGGVTAM